MIAYRLRIAVALVEICVGVAVAAIATQYGWFDRLGSEEQWLRFLAATGAVLLTFLAGAELDPAVMRTKLTEVSVVGLIGFLSPFLVCAAIAHCALGWDSPASLLAGVALSTTSMAVVYAVMLETGFNRTEFGKGILGACFVNDLGTVIALGLLFAPFTYKTVVFVVGGGCGHRRPAPGHQPPDQPIYAHRTAAIRTKWVLVVLFGLGALASGRAARPCCPPTSSAWCWPAAPPGPPLDPAAAHPHRRLPHALLLPARRLARLACRAAGRGAARRARSSSPARSAPRSSASTPSSAASASERNERWYYTLMMSTGLTFGTISALYGLTHGIVTPEQYSYLVAVVIGTAVVPTIVASLAFVPRHLLPAKPAEAEIVPAGTEGRVPLPAAAAVGEAVMRALRDVEAPFVDNELLAAALEELDLEQEETEEVADEG